jgi:hypothetical protein
MSLSKRAKRGITRFSKIQWEPKRALYMMSPKTMISLDRTPPADPLLVSAASEAMAILKKNGEEANANVQAIRHEDNGTVTPNEEGCAPGDVHVQPDDHSQTEESGTGGPQ